MQFCLYHAAEKARCGCGHEGVVSISNIPLSVTYYILSPVDSEEDIVLSTPEALPASVSSKRVLRVPL